MKHPGDLFWPLDVRRILFAVAVMLCCVACDGKLDVQDIPQEDWADELGPPASSARPYRIGYIEGGFWGDYPSHLLGFARGLGALGWIGPLPPLDPSSTGDTRSLWSFLANRAEPGHVVFASDGFYSAGWDETRRKENRKVLLARLREKDDLDLVIAMGTWAGQDLATSEHSVPVLVLSTSDPVMAGIVASSEDSGLPHVHATCDPDRYTRQIRAFHKIVGFKRLGTICEDTEDGRVWGNIENLREAGRELGFELVVRHVPDSGLQPSVARDRCIEALTRLAPEIDAFWLGAHTGLGFEFMPGVLEPLIEHKVPTWCQQGTRAVRRGALLAIAERDYEDVGRFSAKVAAAVFRGTAPGDIGQIYEAPRAVAINLETASRIGFEVPGALKSSADVIYSEIESP